jgi:hypothetical protein
VSAIFLTIDIYSKAMNQFKKQIMLFWKMAVINMAVVFFFYTPVMNNDYLQFPFVSIFPNIIALYFWGLLNKIIDYETTKKQL